MAGAPMASCGLLPSVKQIFVYGPANLSWMSPELKVKFQSKLMANDVKANITVVTNMMKRLPMTMRSL